MLLQEYEQSGSTRSEFAVQKKMRLGTIDGIFARARKRREIGAEGTAAGSGEQARSEQLLLERWRV
eukprot:7377248-Prymnesium_polylepis.1